MKKLIVLLAAGFSLAYCTPSQQADQTTTSSSTMSDTTSSSSSTMSTDTTGSMSDTTTAPRTDSLPK